MQLPKKGRKTSGAFFQNLFGRIFLRSELGIGGDLTALVRLAVVVKRLLGWRLACFLLSRELERIRAGGGGGGGTSTTTDNHIGIIVIMEYTFAVL
jgi:hypothetical protein